jgi:hypothetical protein
METYVKEKRNFDRVFCNSQGLGTTREEKALLSVVLIRYQAFCDRFGREPLPDEPLFFNPEADSPVVADPSQLRAQFADACRKTGIEPSLLTGLWDLGQDDAA